MFGLDSPDNLKPNNFHCAGVQLLLSVVAGYPQVNVDIVFILMIQSAKYSLFNLPLEKLLASRLKNCSWGL